MSVNSDMPTPATENSQIVFIDEKTFAGVKREIITKKQQAIEQVKAFWVDCDADGTLEKLRQLCGKEDSLYGCCAGFSKHGYQYWIAVEVEPNAEAEFEMLTAKESDYALFSCIGPAHETVHNKWRYIYTKWFPYSGYAHRDSPELERYSAFENITDMDAAEYMSEILVPIVKTPVRKPPSRKGMLARLLGMLLGIVGGVWLGSAMNNTIVGVLIGVAAGLFAGNYVKKRIETKEDAQERDNYSPDE